MAQTFSSFHSFFSALETQQTPALVWYSSPGERVELSGRVLVNWVAKTANFLDDELDFADAPQANLEMGPHWRSVAIACAVLNAGGCLNFSGHAVNSSVCFTDRAERANSLAESGEVEYAVAVDREPLSPRFMAGALVAGVVDYCAEVRSFGDAYYPLALPDAAALAVEGVTHREALSQLADRAEQAQASATMLPVAESWSWDYLLNLLAIIAAGQTAILLDPQIDWQAERLERILQDEKAVGAKA